MYTAPDFIKVSAKAKDIFSNYSGTSGCPGDYNQGQLYSGDTSCSGAGDAGTLVYGLQPSYQCYSLLNP